MVVVGRLLGPFFLCLGGVHCEPTAAWGDVHTKSYPPEALLTAFTPCASVLLLAAVRVSAGARAAEPDAPSKYAL